jgi:hypothetical protein
VKLIAGTPRSDSAKLIKDMLMRSTGGQQHIDFTAFDWHRGASPSDVSTSAARRGRDLAPLLANKKPRRAGILGLLDA